MKQTLLLLSILFFSTPFFAQSDLSGVVINEIYYHNTEFIELYNTSGSTIDIGGWELLDNISVRGTIPAGTMIAPGGFHSETFTSKYNQTGDQVILYDPNTNSYIAGTYMGFTFDPTIVTDRYPGATQSGSTENFGSGSSDIGDSFQRSPDGSSNIIQGGSTMSLDNLPVELTFFNGEVNNNEIILSWQTATEINNERFDIEYSTDGSAFETIEKINGAGDSFEQNNYRFQHNSPANGINYYRLKQVDFDGQFEYSKTISISLKTDNDWSLFPTRSQSEVTVEWEESFLANALEVIDLSGKVVFSKILDAEEKHAQVSVINLPTGAYFIKISNGRTISSKPFFKIR